VREGGNRRGKEEREREGKGQRHTAGRDDHGGTMEAARIDDDERGSPWSPLRGKQVDPDRDL